MLDTKAMDRLQEIAGMVRRISPVDRRRPDAFTETKDELAAEIEAIVRAARGGRQSSAPVRRRVSHDTIQVNGRRVRVQTVRSGFGLG